MLLQVRLCDWRNRSSDFVLMEKLIRENDASAVGPIFALHYPIDQLSVRKVAQDRSKSFVGNLLAEDPELYSPKFRALRPSIFSAEEKDAELHIGFISADFNMRPVGKLVQSLPQLMNSYGAKISLWSLELWDGSSVMHTITQGVAIAEVVKGWSPFRIASAINAAKVHVLVDLNGYTEGGGTATCILRPAAVIVNFLGYPGTMGVPAYDVIVADRIVLPPELYPNNFFERALLMPHTYMVCDHHQSYPMDALSMPPPWAFNDTHTLPGFSLRALLSNPRAPAPTSDKVVLANFNHLQKLGPDSFAQWMRIMKQVPDSFLWLLKFPAEAEIHLHRESAAAGVDAARILFLDKVNGDEHLQSKRLADVFVDTFEYNAHVSGLDALWAGLPLLTMAGDRMARRACPSFLVALGLPELIARTDEDYGHVLHRLVAPETRHRFLLHFRKEIASRRETRPLFDTPLWAQHFLTGACGRARMSRCRPLLPHSTHDLQVSSWRTSAR
jgi:predicted O-linked N-acetylglucosamine transferase (SPINDLY family)